jgi:hypothetical protein
MQNLRLKLDGVRHRAQENQQFYTVFTTKTGNETLHSPPSKEVRGVFDKSANATVFTWEWNEDIEE